MNITYTPGTNFKVAALRPFHLVLLQEVVKKAPVVS